MTKTNIAIIIPTYNSSRYTKEFIKGAIEVVREIDDCAFAFMFVDDGSTDDTVQELKRLKLVYPNIKILEFTKNYGQTAALLAGLKHIKADAYILMSVDMQESPHLIKDFITHWKKGYKLCIAYRKYRSDAFAGILISKIFYTIIRIDKPDIPKGGFDYGLLDKEVAEVLIDRPFNFRFLQGDIVDLGFETMYFPCERVRPQLSAGRNNFSMFKFNYFFDGIINVVRIPIKIILLLSSILSISLATVLTYKLVSKFVWGASVSTTTLITLSNYMFLSFLLIMLCIIIEFAYRIFGLVSKKTEYTIRDFTQ
jgi:dolichol-phosphate mannosyltransferase